MQKWVLIMFGHLVVAVAAAVNGNKYKIAIFLYYKAFQISYAHITFSQNYIYSMSIKSA